MAYNVMFLKGSAESYAALAVKDANTFYHTGTDLYLGNIKLSNGADLAALAAAQQGDAQAIASLQQALTTLNGADSVDGSVRKIVKDAIDAVNEKIGTLGSLETTAKTNIVAAINEVKGMAENAATGGVLTIDDTAVPGEGISKVYTFSQNGKPIGTVNIPKDLVVSSGAVVVNPEGQAPGTYIELVIANQQAPLYIDVKDLIDVYTAEQNAAQIQLNVLNGVISATIVDGAVGTAKLAANAVTTAKIADANVTEGKIATDAVVTAKIKDANVTKAKLAEDVINAFDAAGEAAAAYSSAVTAAAADATSKANTAYSDAVSAAAADATTKAGVAEKNAKDYVDTALTWGTIA